MPLAVSSSKEWIKPCKYLTPTSPALSYTYPKVDAKERVASADKLSKTPVSNSTRRRGSPSSLPEIVSTSLRLIVLGHRWMHQLFFGL